VQDISVLYLSDVTLLPGMGNTVHTHDYWHFSMLLSGRMETQEGKAIAMGISCIPPGVPHAGLTCTERSRAINVMFFVHDRKLDGQLRAFPFWKLRKRETFSTELENIMEKAHTISPSQEFINSAFSYYVRLLMEGGRNICDSEPQSETLAERCLSYIERNYMNQVRLEDVAEQIGRNKSYTSSLVSRSTGMTVVEHLNRVRVKHACAMLAYSDVAIEQVAEVCGFTNTKNFCRVFKQIVGTTPTRYRTSHEIKDMCYSGDYQELNVPYGCQVYTYVPSARKCIDWKTPLEYICQSATREMEKE